LDRELDAVADRLRSEFDSLNAVHFNGALTPPQIVLSRRKTFGGYYRPSDHKVVLSWQAYVEHGWDETLNTFRHEVAHIVHFNHSRAFWDLTVRLGCTRRYAAAPLRRRKRRRYVYACPRCGQRVVRYRRLRSASCGVCDKSFNPVFLLRPVAEELN
jgi:predicted SprT family Zn-dependent metalloprotease